MIGLDHCFACFVLFVIIELIIATNKKAKGDILDMKVTNKWLIEQSKTETQQIVFLTRSKMQKNLQNDILVLSKKATDLAKNLKVVNVLNPSYQQFKDAQGICSELIKQIKNYQKKFYPNCRKVQLLCDENDTLLALINKALTKKQSDELKKAQLALLMNRQHLLTMLVYQNLLLNQLQSVCHNLQQLMNHLRQSQINDLRQLALKNAQLDRLWQQ